MKTNWINTTYFGLLNLNNIYRFDIKREDDINLITLLLNDSVIKLGNKELIEAVDIKNMILDELVEDKYVERGDYDVELQVV